MIVFNAVDFCSILYRIGSLVLAQATLELESEGHQLQLKEAAKNVTQATKEQSEQVSSSLTVLFKNLLSNRLLAFIL